MNGYIVEVNNVEQIEEKILLLCNSKNIRKKMSNLIEVPDKIPNRERYAESNINLYEDLLER